MRTILQFSFALLLFQVIAIRATTEKIVFCYWGTWSNYRNGNGNFKVNNINPNLCTHIAYSFFGINNNGEIISLDTWLDENLNNIANTVALKQQNPGLKVIAAVGGWNEGSLKYSAMAGDATKRLNFINSALALLRQKGFDGLDLDWEYPAQRDGIPADRQNFVILLKELKQAFAADSFLLTTAVAAGQTSASISYDIPSMSQYIDYINVMTYDFVSSWDSNIGIHSPLTGSGLNTVTASINYWLQSGAPPNKLVLGIPFYGRTFTLAYSNQNTPGSPSAGPGTAGPYTYESGFLGYNEICEKIVNWNKIWDTSFSAPYAFKDNQWVSYDNQESITLKINFLKSLNLAGAMVWSIESDDFRGACGSAYPLLNTINNALYNGITSTTQGSITTSTTAVVTTLPPVTTTTSTSNPNGCNKNGYFVNANDCSKYYVCNNGIRYDMSCSAGLYFDEATISCNWPALVNCHN